MCPSVCVCVCVCNRVRYKLSMCLVDTDVEAGYFVFVVGVVWQVTEHEREV